MIRQAVQLLLIMLDPRITATPLRVLRELRRRGIQRLPDDLHQRLAGAGIRGPRLLRFAQTWLDGERLSRHRGQWVVNSFLPPFPGRSYERLFENLLSGRHLSPVSAFLAVTPACPCRCPHCSAARRSAEELRTAVWLDAIRQLHGLGVSIIGFTGGEPLRRADLAELVQAAATGGATPIVFTTGLGFSASEAVRLQHAGLWGLCVSLDHPEREVYDRERGMPGVWDSAVAALRTARQTGLYTMVSTLAKPDVVRQRTHERIYALARDLGVDEVRLVEPMPCGRLFAASEGDLLTPDLIRVLRAFHVETNRRGRLPKVCAFNQVESPEIFGCGAGTQHLYIDAAGEVCPCDFTPLSFGNITATPLAELWQQMNLAMGNNPRQHCFIQQHFRVIREQAALGFPLPPARSRELCRAAGTEPLPGYFAAVMGHERAGSDAPGREGLVGAPHEH
jgi:MoaA/NifB/PqqE/SkfB family radical SAM enzyme